MTLDLNAVYADYEAWQKAHQAFDTDEWHLTATKLAGWVPDLLAALAAVEQDRDRLAQLVERYAPIAVPVLADIEERKRRAARMAAHTHYCWTCSDGDAPGEGCHNCRNTGMDQTPCVGCPGPQTTEPSGTEAGK